MLREMKRALAATAICSAVAVAGCGSSGDGTTSQSGSSGASGQSGQASGGAAASSLPQGREHVSLDPADFTTEIDHPYWPMSPGAKWTYRETEDGTVSHDVVTVTNDTYKVAAGVTARVVRDTVTEGGDVVEDTKDYYAQDSAGNLWYLGEDTAEYENGRVKTRKGSWEAGVDGAQAGVILPADPQPEMSYRQEYYAGEAEDRGRILSIDESSTVPFGHFDHMIKTKDYSPLEPDLVEEKFYGRGVGPVREVIASGGTGEAVLLSYHH